MLYYINGVGWTLTVDSRQCAGASSAAVHVQVCCVQYYYVAMNGWFVALTSDLLFTYSVTRYNNCLMSRLFCRLKVNFQYRVLKSGLYVFIINPCVHKRGVYLWWLGNICVRSLSLVFTNI